MDARHGDCFNSKNERRSSDFNLLYLITIFGRLDITFYVQAFVYCDTYLSILYVCL